MRTTHDYTQRYWGHDYVIMELIAEGQKLKTCGWGNDIKKNDYLILENNGNSTRYRVKEIRYENDPRDMWFATLGFAPRERP